MRNDTLLKVFSNIPSLKTQRLILRKIKESDYNDVFEYSSDNRVSEFLLWKPHKSLEYTKEYLSYIKNEYRIGKFYDWAITIKEGDHKGKMIGTCGFTSFDIKNNCAEVGYVINRKFWGQGIAVEALMKVIEFGFEELLLHRIEARYIVGNVNSRKVMEKANMSFEGVRRSSVIVKGEHKDIGVCSIISDEYYRNKNSFEYNNEIITEIV